MSDSGEKQEEEGVTVPNSRVRVAIKEEKKTILLLLQKQHQQQRQYTTYVHTETAKPFFLQSPMAENLLSLPSL